MERHEWPPSQTQLHAVLATFVVDDDELWKFIERRRYNKRATVVRHTETSKLFFWDNEHRRRNVR